MPADFPPIHDLTDAPTLERWFLAEFTKNLVLFGVGPEGGVWLELHMFDERAGWVVSRDGRAYHLGTKAEPVPADAPPWRTEAELEAWRREMEAAFEEARRVDPR